jgi:hypothetical protein
MGQHEQDDLTTGKTLQMVQLNTLVQLVRGHLERKVLNVAPIIHHTSTLTPTKSVQCKAENIGHWFWFGLEPNSNRFCICWKSAFQYHKLAMQGWKPTFQLLKKSPFQIIHNPKGIGLRSQQFDQDEIARLVYLVSWPKRWPLAGNICIL